MKKRCMRPVERLRSTWRSLVRTARRKHDPFLVYSMASFNFGGGWRTPSKGLPQKRMIARATIVLINERFAI